MTKLQVTILLAALAVAVFGSAAQPANAAPRPPEDRAAAPPTDPTSRTVPLGPQPRSMAGGPDLVVDAITLAPLAGPSSMPGADVTVTVTVRNWGTARVEGFYTELRLDHGSVFVVQWAYLTPLAPGGTITLTTDLPLGTSPNRLVAYVDPPTEGWPRGYVVEGPLALAELNNTLVQLYCGDPAHPYP